MKNDAFLYFLFFLEEWGRLDEYLTVLRRHNLTIKEVFKMDCYDWPKPWPYSSEDFLDKWFFIRCSWRFSGIKYGWDFR
jgi:hypothetical protein